MQESKQAALELLYRRIEVRDRLSEEERQALLDAAGESKAFPVGATIVHEGDRPHSCTLLVDGFASRFNVTDDGERQITAIHVAGDFVDLHSFPIKRMDHSIGAMSECQVLMFPHANLITITESFPHLTRLLWLLTLMDGAIHRRWLVAMGRTSALSQMAHFICETYLRLEGVGHASDHRMSLPMTQSELADCLGISAVHANRVLQELRNTGLLTWENKEVHILDWQRLVETGKFSDEYLVRERMPR